MPDPTYVGDIITVSITAKDKTTNAVIDLSAYDTVEMLFRKPDGSPPLIVVATLPNGGTDGLAQYVTLKTDLGMPGNWEVQLAMLKGAVIYLHASPFAFQVLAPIA